MTCLYHSLPQGKGLTDLLPTKGSKTCRAKLQQCNNSWFLDCKIRELEHQRELEEPSTSSTWRNWNSRCRIPRVKKQQQKRRNTPSPHSILFSKPKVKTNLKTPTIAALARKRIFIALKQKRNCNRRNSLTDSFWETGWKVLPRKSNAMKFSQTVRAVFEKAVYASKMVINGQKFDCWE